ncbi:hypothetical protein HQ576_09665 [bacterium]|nr:hypothetical protein [bacterium]
MADPTLCEKCGRCCYAKIILDGEVVYTPFPCPHLDEDTRLCTIYDRRDELNPQCLTIDMGIRMGLFPADCPYVRGLPDYVPPRHLTPTELEDCADAILEAQHSLHPPDGPPVTRDE